jgi:KaiC/GvpD/RAD55 family RecA-like ATPase
MDNKLHRVFIPYVQGVRKFKPYSNNFFDTIKVDILNSKTPWYESIYLYSDEHVDSYKKSNSLSGIKDVLTDRVIFDFDSKTNIKLAFTDTRTVAERLEYFGIDESAIRIYFSSRKGFHIEVKFNNGYINRKEFETIVEYFTKGITTFDEKVRDEQRIIRCPLSFNPESGKYKVPFTYKEFVIDQNVEELDEMINWCAEPDMDDRLDIMSKYTEIDVGLFKGLSTALDTPKVTMTIDERPDFSRKPRHLSSAKFALQEGFFGDGERNTACMILAATYRNLGYSKEIAYNMIKATLRKRAARMGHDEYNKSELWNDVISTVYSDSWRGGTYSERENKLVQKTITSYNLQSEYYEKETVNIEEISNKFKNFADNIDKNVIKTGIGQLDEKLLITTGMMVGILGAPSSGKTTHTISIVENQSLNGIGSLFISADMAENLLYARLMQRYCGIDFRSILEDIKLKPYTMWSAKIRTAWDTVLENFKNVGFSFQSGPTTEDIARRIEEQEQLTGNPVKALFVDYLEKLRCDINDPTQASGRNASRLADLTRDKQLATFLLLQPQKSAGDPSDELLSMRKVKGASVIEQDCRVILTTWRPGFNPDVKGSNPEDVFSSIAIVKNNMGEAGKLDFRFNGATGLLTPMTFEDEKFLDEVKRNAQGRKAAAYKATDGIYEYPEKTTKRFGEKKEAPHEFRHKALPNAEAGDKKNKDVY